MPVKERISDLKKSPLDERSYRVIKLENNLTVLLIQDSNSRKSSAAMTAHVGQYRDPKDCHGLSHFLEHMLFMGSEKYPGAGEFMEFVARNGGKYNGSTYPTHTTFQFDCSNQAFKQGLDIFSHFFISPLLKDESVMKEINAVNSEFFANLNNNDYRTITLDLLLSEPGSINKMFLCGNLETLKKDDTVPRMKEFYKKYYSAGLMSLVLATPLDLEEMEVLVDNLFSAVVDKGIAYPNFKDEPFPYKPESLAKLVKIVPVKHPQPSLVNKSEIVIENNNINFSSKGNNNNNNNSNTMSNMNTVRKSASRVVVPPREQAQDELSRAFQSQLAAAKLKLRTSVSVDGEEEGTCQIKSNAVLLRKGFLSESSPERPPFVRAFVLPNHLQRAGFESSPRQLCRPSAGVPGTFEPLRVEG